MWAIMISSWRTEIQNKTNAQVPRAGGGGVSIKRQLMKRFGVQIMCDFKFVKFYFFLIQLHFSNNL